MSDLDEKGLDESDLNMASLGEFKQALIRDYNDINYRIFGIGVVRQKVDVQGDKIIIIALHKRVPSLYYLNAMNSNVSELADHYLIKGFKNEFKNLMVEKYGFDIVSIFKDYDAEAELSATVVVTRKDVCDYL